LICAMRPPGLFLICAMGPPASLLICAMGQFPQPTHFISERRVRAAPRLVIKRACDTRRPPQALQDVSRIVAESEVPRRACRRAPGPAARPSRRPPPPRTKWTRRVPHPVLNGHAAPLTPYRARVCAHALGGGGTGGRITRCRRRWSSYARARERRRGRGAGGRSGEVACGAAWAVVCQLAGEANVGAGQRSLG
jgi:hypothetical protein